MKTRQDDLSWVTVSASSHTSANHAIIADVTNNPNSLASHSHRNQVSILVILPLDRSNRKSSVTLFLDILFPPHGFHNFVLEEWHVSKTPLQLSTILFGDILDGDEFAQHVQLLPIGNNLNLRDGNGVEPILRPLPHGGEETRSANDKDSIQSFGVMRRGQGARILQMGPQIPKLFDPDFGNVHDVAALTDGCGSIRPRGNGRAEWEHKATHVLVQGEQAQHLPRDFTLDHIFPTFLLVPIGILLVRGDVLVFHIRHFKDVEGNSTTISPARPLRVESTGLFVFVNINPFVEIVELVLFPPVLGGFELSKGVFGDELAGAEVAEESLVVVGSRRVGIGMGGFVVALLLAERLEFLEGGKLRVGELADMPRGPLQCDD